MAERADKPLAVRVHKIRVEREELFNVCSWFVDNYYMLPIRVGLITDGQARTSERGTKKSRSDDSELTLLHYKAL
jgi:hypothetical protein